MVDGNTNLASEFYVRQIYDFSRAYGLSFLWWGADQGDLVEFKLESVTGSFLTSFSDGPARWREVFIPWRKLNEIAKIGTSPDKSRITAILWTVFSPGLRRVDLFRIFEVPILRAGFIARHGDTFEIGCGFTIRAASTGDLKAGFTVV